MDPIHPIAPVTPGLSPVDPAGRVVPLRDQPERRQQREGGRRERRQSPQKRELAGYWDPSDAEDDTLAWEPAAGDNEPGEDDGPRHIDITA